MSTNICKSLLYSAITVAIIACARPPVIPEDPSPAGDEPTVSVVFSASGPATKVTGITSAGETAIGRWAVFAFDNASGWYTHETSAVGAPIPMVLRAGRTYTCYAMVNYPTSGTGAFDPSTVHSPSDLTGKVAWLPDNSIGSLLMFGSVSFTPSATFYDPEDPSSAVSENRSITVTRLVSRIDLNSIAVDFSGKPTLAAKTFTLKGIYVTNAYRTSRYGSDFFPAELSGSRAAWYI